MNFPKSVLWKSFQLSFLIATALFSQVVSATQMGSQWTDIYAGSTVIISLDPPLPRRGEPFTVEISGTWNNSCVDWFEDSDVNLTGQSIRITSWRNYDLLNCPREHEPTHFTRSVLIPDSIWTSIDEMKPLRVELNLAHALNNFHFWFREFDLIWGLHEIPPQIGQGHWISDQRPFQGVNVEQQSDTVLVYDLGYRLADGQPLWLMGDATFHGNGTHGVTYHVSWLNPPLDWETIGSDRVQPKEDEMFFDRSSFDISVVGVNQIKISRFHHADTKGITYKRYVFRLADNQLPVVIPNMAGEWNLHVFDDQNLKSSFPVEFRAATKSGKGLGWYRFKSIDDQWVLDCRANFDGEGVCNLLNEGLGITFDYDLLDFNGNYAKAPLVTPNNNGANQTGILLREGFQLPVLDLQ